MTFWEFILKLLDYPGPGVPNGPEHVEQIPAHATVNLAVIVGHDSDRKGAYSPWIGYEWEFNSKAAQMISDAATGTGCKVKVFERNPVTHSISAVAEQVNKWARENPDAQTLAVSLHFNSFPNTRANGTEMLYWEGSEIGRKWADKLQRCALNCFGLKSRGLLPVSRKGRGGTILYNTSMPCALLEPGFGSNRKDALALKRHWKAYAKEVVTAALNFY